MRTDSRVVYQFGPFEVNVAAGELLNRGRRIKLQELPYRLLVALLERPGEVISREELRSRLWPDDTFVDFDSSLRVAVGKLREALNDDANDPRYIETIPKRGYRFRVSEVRRMDLAHDAAEPAEDPEISKISPSTVALVDADCNVDAAVNLNGVAGSHSAESLSFVDMASQQGYRSISKLEAPSQIWLKIGVGVFAVSVFALGALLVYRWHRQLQHPDEDQALTAIPFTALPGRATSPAFSADGSRIAFAWNGDSAHGAKGFDLYVKALGSETLLRLTQHPAEWISSAWSPDGTQVAFQRLDGRDTGIYVVPALGGSERKLRSTRIPDHDLSKISWSPDGSWIAFSDLLPVGDGTRISLLSTETLEAKQISIPPMCVREGLPAFSHNGKSLAYWCFRNENEGALYSFLLPGGKPRMITPFLAGANGLAWSENDKKLVYSINKGRGADELDEVTVADGSVNRLVFEGTALRPTVPLRGSKLAFESISVSSNIWRKDLLHPKLPDVELMPSSRTQYDAQYSPDGRRMAFVSLRSGVQGVWIGNEDGSNLVQISNPHDMSGSPQWSPDGHTIAFDSRSQDGWVIFLSDVAEQKPRKLVTNIPNVIRPLWSHDGKWIYFSSYEMGREGIYRCPFSGGDAILLSNDIDGFNPQESFDGKTVYFANHDEKSTLRQVALPGQAAWESEVHGLPHVSSARLWTLSPNGIYFVAAETPRSVQYFDFASKQIRPIFEVEKGLGTGLSVSTDGRWLLYSQDRYVNGDIMLVENFH